MVAKTVEIPVRLKVIEEMDMTDLTNRFRHHAPNEKKAKRHAQIRLLCYNLAADLNVLIPSGREKSLAITKLEEVMFWANAALARNDNDEVSDGRART